VGAAVRAPEAALPLPARAVARPLELLAGCPPDKAVVLTVRRHGDALPALARLLTAGIDAEVVEETGGSFLRRVAYRFFLGGHGDRVGGPWYVVVSREAEPAARACLAAPPESPRRPAGVDRG